MNADQSQREHSTCSTSDRYEAAVNWCLGEMQAIKPSMTHNELKGDRVQAYRSQLLAAMIDNNVNTTAKVKRGLARLRNDPSPFAPAIGQFISWCKPNYSDYGLPSVEIAHRTACIASGQHSEHRQWQNGAIYQAALRTGFYELSSYEAEKTIKAFTHHYEQVLEEMANGKEFDIPKLLEKPVHIECKAETAAQALKEIRALFNK
jgi:hypothetical protein